MKEAWTTLALAYEFPEDAKRGFWAGKTAVSRKITKEQILEDQQKPLGPHALSVLEILSLYEGDPGELCYNAELLIEQTHVFPLKPTRIVEFSRGILRMDFEGNNWLGVGREVTLKNGFRDVLQRVVIRPGEWPELCGLMDGFFLGSTPFGYILDYCKENNLIKE